MSNELLEAALEYARRGWHVFPNHTPTASGCSCGNADCKHPGKHPRTKNGWKDATTDTDTIKKWWSRWPNANVGIATKPSGLVVVDIDPRHDGETTWKKISADHDLHAPEVASGGGGRHFYFAAGEHIPAEVGPGVDVIANGSITAPPSVHATGAVYDWRVAPNGSLPSVPLWVRKPHVVINQTEDKDGKAVIFDRWLNYVLAAEEGERNKRLNKAAYVLGGLIHAGLSEADITSCLLDAAVRIGLKSREAIATIRSGINGGKSNPIAWETEATRTPFETEYNEAATLTADPWGEPLTLADVDGELEPLVWVVEGVISAGSVNMLFGDSGALKSMLLADMMTAVSTGGRWLTGDKIDGYATQKGGVMWLDFDNGLRRSKERFRAFKRARNADSTAPFYFYSLPVPTLEANKTDHIAALYARMVKRDVKLLVVDNLGLVSGDADENSKDMAQVMAGFRFLAEKTNSAIILIHHQNKPQQGFTRKTGDTLRGHSSIKAGLDVALCVTREEGSSDIFVTAPKERDAPIKPFGARFAYDTAADGRQLESAKFLGIPFEGERERSNAKNAEEVLAVVVEGDCNTSEIERRLVGKMGRNTIKTALDELERGGLITQRIGERGAKIWTCPT